MSSRTSKQTAARASIQTPTKGARAKNEPATAAAWTGPPAAQETRIADTAARLWAVCAPLAPGEFAPPWDSIAHELKGRLDRALAGPALEHAVSASRLGYADCAKSLLQKAPLLHRVLSDIRGLARSTLPAPLVAEKASASVLPGVALVYETLAGGSV